MVCFSYLAYKFNIFEIWCGVLQFHQGLVIITLGVRQDHLFLET